MISDKEASMPYARILCDGQNQAVFSKSRRLFAAARTNAAFFRCNGIPTGISCRPVMSCRALVALRVTLTAILSPTEVVNGRQHAGISIFMC